MMSDSRARIWAQRGVTIVAVLACIATSQARWTVSATLPPSAPPNAKGALITIEASQEPTDVERRVPGSGWQIVVPREDAGTPWSGRGLYFLPPGFELSQASITEMCKSGGGLCSNCDPPPGAFVRITSVEPVPVWSISATSEENSVHVDKSKPMPSFDVQVVSRRRADLEVIITGPDAARFDRPFVNNTGSSPLAHSYRVTFHVKGGTGDPPADARWTVRATTYGFCRGEGECRAPEEERIRIDSIAPR